MAPWTVAVDMLMETLRSLRAHAGRFLLTSLGVAWGALLLTFLSSQMGGMREHFRQELEEIGPRLVILGSGVVLKDRVGERASRPVELDADDELRVESFASVQNATPNIEIWTQAVRHGRRTKLLNVMGWDEDGMVIRNFRAAQGRGITKLDVERAARVAFLGADAATRLFGRASAVGGQIHIGAQPFRVIGVGVPKGEQLTDSGNRDDLMVVVPYTTAQRWIVHHDRVEQILLEPPRQGMGHRSIWDARSVLGLHHGFEPSNETALWSVDFWDTLQIIFGMFYALQGFFLLAGGATLFVGAVGVMNIMFVVVGERTQEIGLRKALGARSGEVFLQFALEAVVVSLSAGLVGVALGLLLLRAIVPVFAASGIFMPDEPDALTVAFVTAALVGTATVAGVLPAVRAARVPPAEALRAW